MYTIIVFSLASILLSSCFLTSEPLQVEDDIKDIPKIIEKNEVQSIDTNSSRNSFDVDSWEWDDFVNEKYNYSISIPLFAEVKFPPECGNEQSSCYMLKVYVDDKRYYSGNQHPYLNVLVFDPQADEDNYPRGFLGINDREDLSLSLNEIVEKYILEARGTQYAPRSGFKNEIGNAEELSIGGKKALSVQTKIHIDGKFTFWTRMIFAKRNDNILYVIEIPESSVVAKEIFKQFKFLN